MCHVVTQREARQDFGLQESLLLGVIIVIMFIIQIVKCR
jgi:hypothetical protein